MVKKAKSMNNLFKNGKNFEFKKIDFSSKKVSKDVKKLKKKQTELLKSMEVDIEELKKIKFTI